MDNSNKNDADGVGEDKMIAHDKVHGWHLDKRIGLAHILTTVSFVIGLGSVIWAIENRVTEVESRVSSHEVIAEVRLNHLSEENDRYGELAEQRFTEIKRQLNRIEDKADRHTENAHGVQD